MISKPLFFATLVPIVLNDKKLKLVDRAILSVVINLTLQKGYCFAYNKYIAENLNCCLATVSKSINKLHQLGFIPENYPNPNDRGRGHHRTVRKDLIYIPAKVSNDTSLLNNTRVPIKKLKHTKSINNNNNNNEFTIENEKQIVNQKLNVIIHYKGRYFESIKSKYNEKTPINWDKSTVLYLISLCNILNKTFHKDLLKLSPRKQFNSAIELFALLINCKPKFFTDSHPKTFLLFFNKVIMQSDFINKLEQIFTDDQDGYF